MTENTDIPEPSHSLTNLWEERRRSGRNPYLYNIFALLGIEPEGPQRAYHGAVERMRQEIIARGLAHRLGYELTLDIISRAEEMDRSKPEFVSERMLAHTAHKLETDGFKEVMQGLEKVSLPKVKDLLPLPVRDLTFLAERFPELDDDLIDVASAFPAEMLPDVFRARSEEETFFET
jgi:hypothetical protein